MVVAYSVCHILETCPKGENILTDKHNSTATAGHPHWIVRTIRGLARPRNLVATLVALLIVVGLSASLYRGHSNLGVDLATAPRCQVQRGSMRVTILQAGELQPKTSNPIINETEAGCQILEVVDDGTLVKKGDVLVDLDSADLKDKVLTQQSQLATARADYEKATEDLATQDAKFETDLEAAKLKVQLAELDCQKYEQAEYPQAVLVAQMNISVAEGELASAKTKVDSSRTLVQRGFTNKQELDAAELDLQRSDTGLKTKKEDLRILQDFSHDKDQKTKANALTQAKSDQRTLQQSYESGRKSTVVTLESKKTSLEVATNQLARLQRRLEKSHIVSQFDGQVFYPKVNQGRGGADVIQKGANVYPRQKILEFPDLSVWVINVGIPESIIKKVEIGMPAVATVDALPGVIINAVAGKMSVVPDRSAWYDPNSKVYAVTLDIPTTPTATLKPGMSVMVEILVHELDDILQVPLQAVRAEDENHFVYRVAGKTVEQVPVEVGDSNEESIQIVGGLSEGDSLLLYAPVQASAKPGLKERPLDQAKRKNDAADNAKNSPVPPVPGQTPKPDIALGGPGAAPGPAGTPAATPRADAAAGGGRRGGGGGGGRNGGGGGGGTAK